MNVDDRMIDKHPDLNMKVYVLVAGYDYEHYEVYKIFTTKEAAENCRKELEFTNLDSESLWRRSIGGDSDLYQEPFCNYMKVEEWEVE